VVKPFEPTVLLARVRNHLLLGRLTGKLREEVAARTAELCKLNERLKRLSAEASLAEERERRRLAQGLHDGTIQGLALARVRIGSADDPGAALVEVDSILECAIADLRTLTFDLSPPELHLLGLEAALASLVERTRARFRIDLALRVEGSLDPLPPDVAVLAFQGARELTANLIRHAGARSGLILAERAGARLRISAIDDGVGLDESRVGSGFGLFSLRQRLESFGGSLTLAPRSPGACVALSLPIAGQAPNIDQAEGTA
jgi:two-component system, sensor histidine kinase and response regulator